jgi:hypothetical protein
MHLRVLNKRVSKKIVGQSLFSAYPIYAPSCASFSEKFYTVLLSMILLLQASESK